MDDAQPASTPGETPAGVPGETSAGPAGSTAAVTTWSLEQTGPDELRPASVPGPDAGVRVELSRVPLPEFSRFLYCAVGGDWQWTDRLGWDRRQWEEYLARGVETWVAYRHGTPAGYVELDPQDDGVVEIAYFGLLPAFIGQGIGGHLLSVGLARAWDLAERQPQRPATRRVWVHTCSLDGPAALTNYRKRGMRVFETVTE